MAKIKTAKYFTFLSAITSIDGRYRGRTEEFSKYFSEYATTRTRLLVEIEYLIAFTKEIGKSLPKNSLPKLRNIYLNFKEKEALKIWQIGLKINHDTKAVEIYLIEKLKKLGLSPYINYLHFGLTSTDIDNVGLSLSIKSFIEEKFINGVEELIFSLGKIAKENRDVVMPARTHGQIAVPTTAGKEMANFESRLKVQLKKLKALKLGSKIGGAVGNHNALVASFPGINWVSFSKKFLNSLGLDYYPMSTQVEPYDYKVELFQAVKRINLIVIALDEDIWLYLALGYLSLADNKAHVGSSTMPQKINPIGFEMSESYALFANSLFDLMEKKLPINRWQRDLTDKYLLREVGQAFAASAISYENLASSLSRISFNKTFIKKGLEFHWELIAEGVQTILRTTNLEDPYGKLKELTRGKEINQQMYREFIESLDVSSEIKKRLYRLSPKTYIGLAKKLTKK